MKLAARISEELANKGILKYGDLQTTGHSLGGGLATAAAVANGLKATVFNPAGLLKNTLKEAFDHLLKVYKDRRHNEPQPSNKSNFGRRCRSGQRYSPSATRL